MKFFPYKRYHYTLHHTLDEFLNYFNEVTSEGIFGRANVYGAIDKTGKFTLKATRAYLRPTLFNSWSAGAVMEGKVYSTLEGTHMEAVFRPNLPTILAFYLIIIFAFAILFDRFLKGNLANDYAVPIMLMILAVVFWVYMRILIVHLRKTFEKAFHIFTE